MAIDAEALKAPLSDEDPCGPDLMAEDDMGYANFEAHIDMLLPGSGTAGTEKFFELRGEARSFAEEIKSCTNLLQQSRDLRLFVTLAKLQLFAGDIAAFRDVLSVIVHYLREHWEAVNPRGEDGSFDERNGTLEWLDEFQSTILPLQYAPLVRSGAGTLTLRDKVVAIGSAQPREGERLKDEPAIAEILQSATVEDLSALHARLTGIAADLDAIRSVFNDNTGFMQAPTFERLPAALRIAITMVGESLAARGHAPAETSAETAKTDDAAGPAETEGGPTTVTVTLASGRVASAAHARAALAAADDYFARSEPSSPARLLVRQARELIGLSFHEVLERIAPQRLADPIVRLGAAGDVVMSVEALASAAGSPAVDEAQETAEDAFEAGTRPEALALLKDVSAYFRAAEPSSPVPVLIDRATALMTMDFQKLLAELAGPEASSSSSDW